MQCPSGALQVLPRVASCVQGVYRKRRPFFVLVTWPRICGSRIRRMRTQRAQDGGVRRRKNTRGACQRWRAAPPPRQHAAQACTSRAQDALSLYWPLQGCELTSPLGYAVVWKLASEGAARQQGQRQALLKIGLARINTHTDHAWPPGKGST